LLERFGSYLLVERSVTRGSADCYLADLKQFFLAMPEAAERPAATSRKMLHDYARRLGSAGLATTTVARKLVSIRLFYRFLVSEQMPATHCPTGTAGVNPADDIDLPKQRRKLPGVLTQDEVTKLIEAAGTAPARFWSLRSRAMLEVMYGSGLRVSELLSLGTGSVSLADGFLRVMGKRSKERVVPRLPECGSAPLCRKEDQPEPVPEPSRGQAVADGFPEDSARVRRSGRNQSPRHAAHAPALIRHPSARRRGRPARGAGNARARKHRHDPDIYPR
jgi:integrase